MHDDIDGGVLDGDEEPGSRSAEKGGDGDQQEVGYDFMGPTCHSWREREVLWAVARSRFS